MHQCMVVLLALILYSSPWWAKVTIFCQHAFFVCHALLFHTKAPSLWFLEWGKNGQSAQWHFFFFFKSWNEVSLLQTGGIHQYWSNRACMQPCTIHGSEVRILRSGLWVRNLAAVQRYLFIFFEGRTPFPPPRQILVHHSGRVSKIFTWGLFFFPHQRPPQFWLTEQIVYKGFCIRAVCVDTSLHMKGKSVNKRKSVCQNSVQCSKMLFQTKSTIKNVYFWPVLPMK